MRAWIWLCSRLVPASARDLWREEWEGEFHHDGGSAGADPVARLRLAAGIGRDAWTVRRLVRRDSRGVPQTWLVRDLRFAGRTLRRAPVFALTAIVTLALGIGSATTIFSVVDALLLSPLPFPDADRLVLVWQRSPGLGVEEDWLSPAQFRDIRDQNGVFDRIAVVGGGRLTHTTEVDPEEVGYIRTNSDYLEMLGARPWLGRLPSAEEDAPDAPIRVMLTHGFWTRRLGADPAVVGSTINLHGTDYEVLGVLGPDLLLDKQVMPAVGSIGRIDVVLTRSMREDFLENRGSENYNIVARLAPGVSEEQAQADIDVIAARMDELYPTGADSGFTLDVVSLMDQVVGDVRTPLSVLLASVGVLLLIACGNVASLLLSRADMREPEMGLRAAIGAGRRRLFTGLLTESAVLAGTGGLLGMALSWAAIRLLWIMGPTDLPRLGEVSIDLGVASFALAVTGLTSLLFGLVPALRLSRTEVAGVLKSGGQGSMGKGAMWARFNLSSGLVVAEIALSLMLLVGAGLLMRSFSRVLALDPGFQAEGRITMRISLPPDADREEPEVIARHDALLDGIRAVPGVTLAGSATHVPMGPGVAWGTIDVAGYEPSDPEEEVVVEYRAASPGYFEAMGILVLQGRGFGTSDTGEPLTALVDRKFAERFWAGLDPLGRQVNPLEDAPASVVGVVEDVRHYTMESASRPTVYFPNTWWVNRSAFYVIATELPSTRVLPGIRSAVAAVDPSILINDVATMEERLVSSLAARRFVMRLLQVFSGVALVLALVGVYGVIAHRVARGRHEIGMRIALGASTGDILGLAVRHGAVLAVLGVTLGLAGALALTGFMDAMLFGVASTDPGTYLGTAALIATVTLLACAVPARRAARLDPLRALRSF